MKSYRALVLLFWLLALALIPPAWAEAADAVVGGTCDEAAFNAAPANCLTV